MHPDDIWSNAIFDAVNDIYVTDVDFSLEGIKYFIGDIKNVADNFGKERIDSFEVNELKTKISELIDAIEFEEQELEDIADDISVDVVKDIKSGVLSEELMNNDGYLDREKIKEHALDIIAMRYFSM